jgi:hypothetical protein
MWMEICNMMLQVPSQAAAEFDVPGRHSGCATTGNQPTGAIFMTSV